MPCRPDPVPIFSDSVAVSGRGYASLSFWCPGAQTPEVKEYKVPKELRFVALGPGGCLVGAPEKEGPWERLEEIRDADQT